MTVSSGGKVSPPSASTEPKQTWGFAGETKPTANMILSAHIVEGSFIDLYHWTNDMVCAQLYNCTIDPLIAIMNDVVDSGVLE